MKKVLCLFVLIASGNTFGSTTQTLTSVTEMANQLFAPCMQDMSVQNSVMVKMSELCKPLNSDLMKQCMQCMQDAYHEGIKCGLMAAGTHMQATMAAMANVVKTTPTKITK